MDIDLPNLTVLHYPAAPLRRRAQPVGELTPQISALAARMIDLMLEEEGVGLAAPQVGVSLRLFVAHVPASEGRSVDANPMTATPSPVVYLNPVITAPGGGLVAGDEGCLSLPDIRGDVLRPPVVTISAINLEGKPFSQTAAGLLARCWQHETDHLDGILIIDKMTPMSRLKNRAAVRDLERMGNWSDTVRSAKGR